MVKCKLICKVDIWLRLELEFRVRVEFEIRNTVDV